jgi:hypothetical protein
MHTFVSANADTWVMESTTAIEDTFTVYMVNLSIPGYVFMHSALTASVKAVESVANLPERMCAIILCPNTGTFGDSYSDASIMNAAHDVEDLLKDPELGIMYLPISMTFDEASIPVQSQRPGQHPAFMVLSSAMKPDGKPKSNFALSKLWIRRSVTQLPVQKLKDCVNPLAEIAKGDFRREERPQQEPTPQAMVCRLEVHGRHPH